jgi:hypothetical protein
MGRVARASSAEVSCRSLAHRLSTVDDMSMSLSTNGRQQPPRIRRMPRGRPMFPGLDTGAQRVTDLRIKRLGFESLQARPVFIGLIALSLVPDTLIVCP